MKLKKREINIITNIFMIIGIILFIIGMFDKPINTKFGFFMPTMLTGLLSMIVGILINNYLRLNNLESEDK